MVVGGVGRSWDRIELDLLGRWQSGYRDFSRSTNPAIGDVPVEIHPYVSFTARAAYRLTDQLTAALVARQFNAPRLLEAAGPKIERQFIASLTARF